MIMAPYSGLCSQKNKIILLSTYCVHIRSIEYEIQMNWGGCFYGKYEKRTF